MSENDSDAEKSQAPSAKRLRDAREEGQIPRARELGTLFMYAAALLFITVSGSSLVDGARRVMRIGLTLSREHVFNTAAMSAQLSNTAMQALQAFGPFIGLIAVGGVLGTLALGGWNFTNKAFEPNFGRLSPMAGLKRMFSIHSLGELGKAMVGVAMLAALSIWYGVAHVREWMSMTAVEPIAGVHQSNSQVIGLLMILLPPMIVIAAIDAGLAWYRHHSQLKMTLEEMKRENRETEGNPEIKGRIRQQQRAMARKRMMAAVPGADVVVTNPTHFAVAIRSREGSMRAPRVVAKGTDLVAARIRGLAAEHGVLLVEAPPLARALHKHVELEDEIPAALFTAVAQVLAYVYQLRAGANDAELGEIPVPDELDPANGAARLSAQQPRP